jgi:hypothetical protein
MSNACCFFSNIDWLARNKARVKATHRDNIFNPETFCLNEVWQREGRRNPRTYTIFYDYFLPCVIKKSVFDRQVAVATNDSTLCTVSDEAFALLLLENSFDRWMDIF